MQDSYNMSPNILTVLLSSTLTGNPLGISTVDKSGGLKGSSVAPYSPRLSLTTLHSKLGYVTCGFTAFKVQKVWL